MFLVYHSTHYTTAGCVRITLIHQKLYRAVCWRITTNVIGYITEKHGRLFCYIVTHFRGCNGIGDLLTRQARNFIYNSLSNRIVYWQHLCFVLSYIKIFVKQACVMSIVMLCFLPPTPTESVTFISNDNFCIWSSNQYVHFKNKHLAPITTNEPFLLWNSILIISLLYLNTSNEAEKIPYFFSCKTELFPSKTIPKI